MTKQQEAIDKLKWQINAETSITQITLWTIIAMLSEKTFIIIIACIFITGNFFTFIKSAIKVGKDYFD